MRKMPPLRALQVFEVAARQLHFSQAAQELCITQSAVSHQIKLLENHFDTALFHRKGRAFSLTDKGLLLYKEVTRIFNELAEVNQQILGQPNAAVRLAVFSSFAVKWLIPRLTSFRQLHPEIKVRLDMITDEPSLSDSVADMFITGQSQQQHYFQRLLHKERLIPVCSPGRLQQLPIQDIDALWQHPLLIVDEGPLGLDWHNWSSANGIVIPSHCQHHLFSHVLLAVEAAIAGQGVALASDFMVESDIDNGKLVALPLPSVNTGFEFNFLCKQRRLQEPAIATFSHWLFQQTIDNV
ncbi:LysR substrate-binding domain-containing protein [Shewanella waksmanii]|uniref:LysR substrate-binding domain-containing protein n=1 Tax=Shewanella waksmanii TaxID=213783 RepID=UPI0004908E88|nr:LysR substrate-binding domain-containing protein [Shewanella waksmanii]